MGSLVTLAGCTTWLHAPGHAHRGGMTKHELRVVTGKACAPGTCSKKGELGTFRFENVSFFSEDGARTRTRFDIEHEGAHARCHSDDPGRPLSCTIESGEERYLLALGDRCTSGTLASGDHTWVLQTDSVEIGGHVAPSREVSLSDDTGVVAHADAGSRDNLDVYTRAGAPVAPAKVVALVAVQAFLQLEDLPRACMSQQG